MKLLTVLLVLFVAVGDLGAVGFAEDSLQAQAIQQQDSPLKVMSIRAYWNDEPTSHSYWDVNVSLKNVSNRKIIAYEVTLSLYNSFGERLDGFRAVSTEPVAAGEVDSGTWEHINMSAGGVLVKADVYRVKFSDGSTWVEK